MSAHLVALFVLFSACARPVPETPSIHIEPPSPTTGDSLRAVIDSDADGSYAYAWTRNGAVTDVAGYYVEGALVQKGDVWVAEVTMADGEQQSPPAIAVTTVVNSPPVAGDVFVDPGTPVVTDVLDCAADAADRDGDTLFWQYVWRVNGQLAGSSETLSGGFAHGDVVTCTATASDGSKSTVTRSADVLVADSPPELTLLSFASPPAAGRDVVAIAAASDADGDPVTLAYRWLVDGVPIDDDGPTLPAAEVVAGENVIVVVSPSDDVGGNGAPQSATAVVTE